MAVESLVRIQARDYGMFMRLKLCPAAFNLSMAISINWGILFVGVLIIRTLLFGVYIRAAGFLETTRKVLQEPGITFNSITS